MRIVWSAKAVQEIGDHLAYIAQDSERASKAWADDLFRRVEAILEFPEIGRISAKGGGRGIREIIIDSDFVLTYRIHKRNVMILAFIQATRRH